MIKFMVSLFEKKKNHDSKMTVLGSGRNCVYVDERDIASMESAKRIMKTVFANEKIAE